MRLPDRWGVTAEEVVRRWDADELAPGAPGRWLRGVDVAADPATTWRWVCQLRAAPYSYDWVDNLGRRSPRTLTPGLEHLETGQRMAGPFRIRSVRPGEQVTLVAPGGPVSRALGDVVLGYAVTPGPAGSRLVGVLRVGRLPWAVDRALCWGDLVMMRRQLHVLAGLAGGR
ncbi:hypothetical protein [Klenkia taihuensis]|uniref:Polyketide cyclase / dehydrase and lipid transport n=1 Tax=Klenkia taihuensis TaxID=1225127 RepID=A0A1I1M710_9ACTN|nr:hypothetical protein [Klenkia taihuensis]GHE14113.1 hypothetical protein GCM10011381_39260 [Klenkia taihuensis]SFC81189.1 hypothetical protein SAMN05661030_1588 [Klenkia taihuensis]